MQAKFYSKHPSLVLAAVFSDFKQLTKMGLSLSVVFSSLAGYLLGTEVIEFSVLTSLAIGGYLMVGASNAFNQLLEKDSDAQMKRTQNRPLPAGRMRPSTALAIAFSFTIAGLVILYGIHPKCALFGAISIFLYTCAYTPLKPITPLAVFVGAIPGAIPFMLGWVAATGDFSIEPGMLFLIQFLWQFPHFWAIGWLEFDDYKKAGFNLMPMGKKNRKAVLLMIGYTCSLIIVSIIPVLKLTGQFYIHPITATALLGLGVTMLWQALKLYR
ncbi:MAG: heme o synthase, partial [Lutibacter sp.]|nr:heme o synthase [Lutibacter sp.]